MCVKMANLNRVGTALFRIANSFFDSYKSGEIADKEIAAFPRDSSKVRLVNRCAVTSRPRGVVQRWRLSRIVWRHLADYNKLSGVQRAMW